MFMESVAEWVWNTHKGCVSKADVAIGKIRKLYAIERRIADLSHEEKYQARQTLSKPVLDDFKQWLIPIPLIFRYHV